MSDAPAANDGQPADNAETNPPANSDVEPDANALGDAGKKALQAERDARSVAEKAAKDLQAKLDEIETAKLSDLEKLQKRADKAEKEAAQLTTKLARAAAIREHKIDDDFADFVTGNTADEIEASAKALAEKLAAKLGDKTPDRRPDRTQGRQSLGSDSTADKFAAAIEDLF